MKIFDTHAHYDDEKFDEDREEIIKKIYEFGIEKCVNIGCDIKTSEKSIQLAKKYDFIYASCGIHPSEIKIDTKEEDLNKIEELSKDKKVVAIGEVGLDYNWNKDNKEFQKEMFIKQIELANKLNLPVVIHTRDAIDDTIEIIKNQNFKNGAILHCCPFNKYLVKEGLKKGFFIAFGGTCTFKNSKNADDILKLVPIKNLLVETDTPYLAPEPKRGTRNDSRNLELIINKIASVKGYTPEEIAQITYNNAKNIFRIKE